MAQTIKLKRSAVAGQKPTTAQVELGEVAVNTTDQRAYSFGSDTGIFEFVTGTLSTNAAGGDVVTFNGNPAEYVFPGTGTLNIPVGTNAERPTDPSTGDIRFNTDTQSFEGYDEAAGAWGSLGGVKDVDQDTYITTESSPTADEDTFTFYAAGSTVGTWNTTLFDINTDTNIDGNLTTTANTTIGDAAADTLTVNATSTFNAPVDMNSTLNVDGNFTTTANTTIGNAAADTLTVNATANFANNMTLGSSGADTITVNGTMITNGGLTVQAGDPFNFDGLAFNNAHKFTIKDASGTIVFGGWVFDTDTNSAN